MSESPQQMSEPVVPGEAGPRLVAAIGRILARELPLVLRAAYQVRARPGIALAVVALATVGVVSQLITTPLSMRHLYPERDLDAMLASRNELRGEESVVQRWLDPYTHDLGRAVMFGPLKVFAYPLAGVNRVADGWIRLLALPFVPAPGETGGESRSALGRTMAAYAATQIVMVAIGTLVLALILGWMRGSEAPLPAGGTRLSWRRYYGPILVVGLAYFAAWSAAAAAVNAAWRRIAGIPLSDPLSEAIIAVPGVALMLAPFVVVGRGVGWRRAIVEGLRLLRARWLGLLTVFVVYRIAYEAVAIWRALAPWPLDRRLVTLSTPGPALWTWVGQIGLAVLGLWVAYAFMEIARRPEATA